MLCYGGWCIYKRNGKWRTCAHFLVQNKYVDASDATIKKVWENFLNVQIFIFALRLCKDMHVPSVLCILNLTTLYSAVMNIIN